MRQCSVIRNDGQIVPAHLIRSGPKNSRVTFNGDRGCSELVETAQIFEIFDPGPKAGAKGKAAQPKPYLGLCTQAAELSEKMTATLRTAGVEVAANVSIDRKWEMLRQLRDETHVVVEGVLLPIQDADGSAADDADDDEDDDNDELDG